LRGDKDGCRDGGNWDRPIAHGKFSPVGSRGGTSTSIQANIAASIFGALPDHRRIDSPRHHLQAPGLRPSWRRISSHNRVSHKGAPRKLVTGNPGTTEGTSVLRTYLPGPYIMLAGLPGQGCCGAAAFFAFFACPAALRDRPGTALSSTGVPSTTCPEQRVPSATK